MPHKRPPFPSTADATPGQTADDSACTGQTAVDNATDAVVPPLTAPPGQTAVGSTAALHDQRTEEVTLPVPAQPSIMNLIELALNKELDVSVLKELLSTRRDYEAGEAEKALIEACHGFKTDCPIIVKRKKGAKARYAPLEDIEEVIKPLLVKHQLCYDYDIINHETYLEAICTVTHILGASKKRSSGPTPYLDPISNRQGGTAMNLTQALAGTVTMAKRYALGNVFGLVFAEEDTDGATVYAAPTPSQLTHVKELIGQTKFSEPKWTKQYRPDAPEGVSVEQLSTGEVAHLILRVQHYLATQTASPQGTGAASAVGTAPPGQAAVGGTWQTQPNR